MAHPKLSVKSKKRITVFPKDKIVPMKKITPITKQKKAKVFAL